MRGRALIMGLLAGLLVPAASAEASRLVTLTTTSRYVNPDNPKVTFNDTHRPDLPPPKALPVNVLLPDGYDGRRRFPVLYLLHGHGDTYNSWMAPHNGDLRHLAAGLPAIVVMPEGGRGWYTDWWNGGKRGDPAWERYHMDELVPLIGRTFLIRRARRWHAIAGLSMGGEGAMYYAERRPGYFGSVASFSGPLSIQRPEWPTGFDTQGEDHNDVFGDPDGQSAYWAGHNPTALAENLGHTRVFVAVGDGNPTRPSEYSNYFGQVAERDLREHATDFVNEGHSLGLNLTYDPRAGIHDWPYWRQHLTDAMHWGLFGLVGRHPRRWTFKTINQRNRVWGLRITFTKAPAELATFKRSGRFLNGAGTGTVRIRFPGGKRRTAKLPFRLTMP